MVLMFPVASHGPVAEFWVSGFAVLGLRFASRVVPPLSGVFERVVRIGWQVLGVMVIVMIVMS